MTIDEKEIARLRALVAALNAVTPEPLEWPAAKTIREVVPALLDEVERLRVKQDALTLVGTQPSTQADVERWQLEALKAGDAYRRAERERDEALAACAVLHEALASTTPMPGGTTIHQYHKIAAALATDIGKREAERVKALEKVAEAARELADLTDDIVDQQYAPDRFSSQPVRVALAALDKVKP